MIKVSNKIYLEKKQGLLFAGLLVVIVILFPFFNFFHLLHPMQIFGKSAWIVVPIIIIGLLYFPLLLSKKSRFLIIDLWVLVIIFLSWIIFVARGLMYEEARNFLDIRFIATALIFIAFSSHLISSLFLMRAVAYAVFIQSMVVAFVRVINFYLFPNVMTSWDNNGAAFLNTEGELTRDLLVGSSISANHIVCGMFVLLSLFRNNVIKLNNLTFIIVQFFLMISTFNTGSRFPMAVSAFLFLSSLFNSNFLKLKNIIALIITCIGLFAIFALTEFQSYDYFSRFNEGSGGRGAKLEATFILISNSFFDFLIGSSDKLINSTEVDGMLISDNSYGLIATSFGVPFMLIFFGYLLFVFKKIKSDNISLFMICYIAVGFAITNCILWEPWVFTVFVSFSVVASCGRNSICNSKIHDLGR